MSSCTIKSGGVDDDIRWNALLCSEASMMYVWCKKKRKVKKRKWGKGSYWFQVMLILWHSSNKISWWSKHLQQNGLAFACVTLVRRHSFISSHITGTWKHNYYIFAKSWHLFSFILVQDAQYMAPYRYSLWHCYPLCMGSTITSYRHILLTTVSESF